MPSKPRQRKPRSPKQEPIIVNGKRKWNPCWAAPRKRLEGQVSETRRRSKTDPGDPGTYDRNESKILLAYLRAVRLGMRNDPVESIAKTIAAKVNEIPEEVLTLLEKLRKRKAKRDKEEIRNTRGFTTSLRGVRNTLVRLEERGLVERSRYKPGERHRLGGGKYYSDVWDITDIGLKHLAAISGRDIYTPEANELFRADDPWRLFEALRWRAWIARAVVRLPAGEGERAHEVWRVDRIMRTRPTRILARQLELADRRTVDSPAAYFTVSSLGSIADANRRRVMGWMKTEPWFRAHPETRRSFLKGVLGHFKDPFRAAKELFPAVKAAADGPYPPKYDARTILDALAAASTGTRRGPERLDYDEGEKREREISPAVEEAVRKLELKEAGFVENPK